MVKRSLRYALYKNRPESGHSDPTETDLVSLRQTIHSIIMSSEGYEEAGYKLQKIMEQHPGQEMTLCIMLLKCCSDDRPYLAYYGLLGQRMCMESDIFQRNFHTCFVQQYSKIHRVEGEDRLSNTAKFFAHLLASETISWHVLSHVRLAEEEMKSEVSRIFVTVLFQELGEQLGIRQLSQRLMQMEDSAQSVLPRDNLKNARFAINFFASIGLGGITGDLVDYWKIKQQHEEAASASFNDGEIESGEEERKKKKNKRSRT